MADIIQVDLFCEDRAHEEFIKAIVERVGCEEKANLVIRVVVARGGHGKVLDEFKIYQRARSEMGPIPDVLIIAIDANCKGHNEARNEIESKIDKNVFSNNVLAIPDPHIERWYMADPLALKKALGAHIQRERRKCERDLYKSKLIESLHGAGHLVIFGGAEFAREIVKEMNLYRAAKNEPSLKHFLDALKAKVRRNP